MSDKRIINYGPADLSWELWHTGRVLDRENVVLIHGFRFPWSSTRGKCDKQFAKLAGLMQTMEHKYNVWLFEYEDGHWGTMDAMAKYASRLGEAMEKISKLSGRRTCSIVASSMGGIIARKYIAIKGSSRIDKLLTIATPHMGTLKLQPAVIKWIGRFVPRATFELRPDSKLIWDLNTNISSSSVSEFASIGGYANGSTDGSVELASTSLVKCNPDGTVAENFYFNGVNRSHRNIFNVANKDDEVFHFIRSFLNGGLSGIESAKPIEEPGDYNVKYFLTFALKHRPRWRMIYPSVVVKDTGRCYWGLRVFSQGAKTEDGSHIFTVQLQPDDDGEVHVYFAPGEYKIVCVHRGQSTIVAEPIDTNLKACNAFPTAAIRRFIRHSKLNLLQKPA